MVVITFASASAVFDVLSEQAGKKILSDKARGSVIRDLIFIGWVLSSLKNR